MGNVTRAGGNPFVLVDRRWVADDRLSYTALGILACLCALGPYGGLDYDVLLQRAGQSADEVKAALWDLRVYGYLVHGDEGVGLVVADPFETEPTLGGGDE